MLASSDTIRLPTSVRSPQTVLAPRRMAAIPTARTTTPIELRRWRGVKLTKPGRIEPTGMEFEGEHHVVTDVAVVDESRLIALRSDLFAGSQRARNFFEVGLLQIQVNEPSRQGRFVGVWSRYDARFASPYPQRFGLREQTVQLRASKDPFGRSRAPLLQPGASLLPPARRLPPVA